MRIKMYQSAAKLTVIGRVQGVGFRPFIYQLALDYQLKGTVQNNMDGVHIHVEGNVRAIEDFQQAILLKAPRLSKISQLQVKKTEVKGCPTFEIIESTNQGDSQLVIPIDAAVCHECLEEMKDPTNIRYGYAFINCTQCGPRYTIIKELPYDRPKTTMANFQMCEKCASEYEDISNRRHHAQPIACPTCGPQVSLLNKKGETIATNQSIDEAIRLLKLGKIVAVKGIGGFHLCVDATNNEAVETLRIRKKRPNKPFAILSSSIEKIREIAFVSPLEESLLTSSTAPIVILKKVKNNKLAPTIAKNLTTIGVMLPYTPLHYLLVDDEKLPYLVATSANISGNPLIYEKEVAIKELNSIADYFLIHNRDILRPIDDSVLQVSDNEVEFLRRARGYVPDPIFTKESVHNIAALGSIQKNTFTLGRHQQVFIGPHIGDLTNYETIEYYKEIFSQLTEWVTMNRPTIVKELHPNFPIKELTEEIHYSKIVEVQHHHAHMAGCMAENKLTECFGLVLDGTGYGIDGAIWGFELFYGSIDSVKRLGHLAYWPMIGGDKAVREPWRNAVTLLTHLFSNESTHMLHQLFKEKKEEISLLQMASLKGINQSLVGSCGRLFDCISAMLNICQISTYDGQAAIELSELVDENKIYDPYIFRIFSLDLVEIHLKECIEEIYQDILANVPKEQISGRFHETIVQAIKEMIVLVQKENKYTANQIVLSGGSMHNRYLKKRLKSELTKLGLQVYSHKEIPSGDGGLSYGQLMVAANKETIKER